MNKILLSCICLLPAARVFSQATINQSHFPVVGTLWTEFEDQHYGTHVIPPAGAGQTWNYASAFNITDTNGLAFMDPATLPPPFNTDFPNADMAIISPKDTAAQYFKSQANGFFIDGFSSHAAGSVPPLDKFDFTPDQLFFPAPLTYGTTASNQSRYTVTQPAASGNPGVKLTSDHYIDIDANAWGSLTTPAGTYPNTVRVRRMEYVIDSTFIDLAGTGTYSFLSTSGPHDTTITHFFMNATNPLVLMTIDEDPFNPGTSDGATYLVNLPFSVHELNGARATAYPNPATNSEMVHIRAGRRFDRITVADASGALVYQDRAMASDRVDIRTANLLPGIYYYRLYDAEGKTLSSGAFVVTR